MNLRSLLVAILINACILNHVWGSSHVIEEQEASSSAPNYSLKTLPNDIMTQILPYLLGSSLQRLWETGDKKLQDLLTKNVQIFDTLENPLPLFTFFMGLRLVPENFFTRFPALTELTLAQCIIKNGDLTNQNTLPTQLKKLDITKCQLEIFPDNLLNLTELSIFFSQFEEAIFINRIASLTRLTTLRVNSCQLTTLPKNLSRLTNLTYLDMSNNQLEQDHTSLNQIPLLTNLNTLNVRYCSLTTWPQKFFQLPNLTDLDLSHNPFSENTSSEETITSTHLMRLNLEQCGLTTWPRILSQCSSLTKLYLTYNKFENDRLPDEVLLLTQLKELAVGGHRHHLEPAISRENYKTHKPNSFNH